jgi:uncharacterized protein (DUF488 family)
LSSPVFTIGHGTRPLDELIGLLAEAGAQTLVDIRRFPSSRRNPQFDREPLADALAAARLGYVHAETLGGRRRGEPGEERFWCIREPAFRSYAARMSRPEWQAALGAALAEPVPCFMCAETDWRRCHRRFVADFLLARGLDVIHLVRPGVTETHALADWADVREGRLLLCGEVVA